MAVDLFEQYQTLPQQVQDMILKFEQDVEESENGYDTCKQFVKDLEAEGYTCEYGLDASPYNLRKL